MEARVLPQAEWPRLAGTEAETLWPKLDPRHSEVLVVEDNGEIVATWVMLSLVHVECLWIEAAHRGSFSVVRRLLSKMRETATNWGIDHVITGSLSSDVTDLILRLGGSKIPGECFVLPVNGPARSMLKMERSEPCQQPEL